MVLDDPKDIVQDLLDRQGDATMAEDVEVILGFFALPCTFDGLDGYIVAEDEADMRRICETFIENVRRQQLTHMSRLCREAAFRGPDTICATYETRFTTCYNQLHGAAYASFIILRFQEDRWKITNMQFATEGKTPAVLTLKECIPAYPREKAANSARRWPGLAFPRSRRISRGFPGFFFSEHVPGQDCSVGGTSGEP